MIRIFRNKDDAKIKQCLQFQSVQLNLNKIKIPELFLTNLKKEEEKKRFSAFPFWTKVCFFWIRISLSFPLTTSFFFVTSSFLEFPTGKEREDWVFPSFDKKIPKAKEPVEPSAQPWTRPRLRFAFGECWTRASCSRAWRFHFVFAGRLCLRAGLVEREKIHLMLM